jgi:hypothetical protein
MAIIASRDPADASESTYLFAATHSRSIRAWHIGCNNSMSDFIVVQWHSWEFKHESIETNVPPCVDVWRNGVRAEDRC